MEWETRLQKYLDFYMALNTEYQIFIWETCQSDDTMLQWNKLSHFVEGAIKCNSSSIRSEPSSDWVISYYCFMSIDERNDGIYRSISWD